MTGSEAPIDAVVTHHTDGFRSGVARFNELLAEHLGVPLVALSDRHLPELGCPLLSFKLSELSVAEASQLGDELDRFRGDVFLHEFSGLELELLIVSRARRVHCGNFEIYQRVHPLNSRVDVLWTPGLIMDDRVFERAEISVFSFGMAHKMRIDIFRRLRDLLESSGRSYTVYVSAANHETASLGDAQVVFEEMQDVFPRGLYFMGNLSDVVIFNYLRLTTFFAAFFPGGVRANNTSVASALERGAVVVTNLDRYSPPELVHMENLIDIERCEELPTQPSELERISARAVQTGEARGWEQLVSHLRRGTRRLGRYDPSLP